MEKVLLKCLCCACAVSLEKTTEKNFKFVQIFRFIQIRVYIEGLRILKIIRQIIRFCLIVP